MIRRMALLLSRSDFWPPIVGGWRSLSGHVVATDAVITILESVGKSALTNDQEYLAISDEMDWQGFLEDRFADISMPPPIDVVFVREGRGAPLQLRPGFYAVWSEESWASSPKLREVFAGARADTTLTLRIWDRLHVPAGAGLIFWILVAVGVWMVTRALR